METGYRSDMHEIVYDVAGRGNPMIRSVAAIGSITQGPEHPTNITESTK
jgi:hypothetical protein